MARTKPTSSSAEQSGKTGAGGEPHQQPPDWGSATDDKSGHSHCRQPEFAHGGSAWADLARRLHSAGKDYAFDHDTHFDHERIPERIVHVRGSGANGSFEITQSLTQSTKADLLQWGWGGDGGSGALPFPPP